jgi:hypothetical protein
MVEVGSQMAGIVLLLENVMNEISAVFNLLFSYGARSELLAEA